MQWQYGSVFFPHWKQQLSAACLVSSIKSTANVYGPKAAAILSVVCVSYLTGICGNTVSEPAYQSPLEDGNTWAQSNDGDRREKGGEGWNNIWLYDSNDVEENVRRQTKSAGNWIKSVQKMKMNGGDGKIEVERAADKGHSDRVMSHPVEHSSISLFHTITLSTICLFWPQKLR